MKRVVVTLSLNFLFLQIAFAQSSLLQECWNKLAKPVEGKYITLSYSEKLNQLYHSPEPWMQLNYEGKGTVWFNETDFLKQDTLSRGKRTYFSKTHYNGTELLFLDHGDKDLSPITKKMFSERSIRSLRYTPAHVVALALQQNFVADKRPNTRLAVYEGRLNNMLVKVCIRRSDSLVSSIQVLSDDELYGDLWSFYTYTNYLKTGSVYYPQAIDISRNNGKVKDEVKVNAASVIATAPSLLEKPAGYLIKEDESEKPDFSTEKYSDHIYFINLRNASSKILLVEFKDFLLIAEAPLNSKNGELIINEAKKIAPGKPIKYFVAGHHHPHYLGGMRAFVHKGATVLSVERNKNYLYYLTNSPHALNPDSLHLQPKPLQLEIIKDSILLSDGKYQMTIYSLGEKSGHTKDYLVYHFPKEKMLFEDDLVWIASKGEPRKAYEGQTAIYNLIKEKGLGVETIIQSWVTDSGDYKTIIPFKDLEASVNVK